jgi:hypothetical protein
MQIEKLLSDLFSEHYDLMNDIKHYDEKLKHATKKKNIELFTTARRNAVQQKIETSNQITEVLNRHGR